MISLSTQENKKAFHPRSFHNEKYDFKTLINSESSLNKYVKPNKYGDLSINFADPQAVIALNKALLSYFYEVKNWSIPSDYLCPAIPGRADYVHYIADLLSVLNGGNIPKGTKIKGLDIGVGANGIYPIVGTSVYKWSFLASDIDENSIKSVENNINSNESLKNNIKTKLQVNSKNIFKDVILAEDRYDFTLCNPPFHKSLEDALAGNKRKIQNLTKQTTSKAKLNFGGKNNELWCEGGEISFIKKMISQSLEFSKNCLWFTTLVSKKENLAFIYKTLENTKALEVKTIQMHHGQKTTRIVAWSFLSKSEQENWAKQWEK